MIIALNNKCNLTKESFRRYIEKLTEIKSKSTLIICPSLIFINNVNLDNFALGSQDVSSSEQGAHTGDVSAKQLKSFDVKYTIVGHSERRHEHGETSKEINRKLKHLLAEDIIPIMCIGETKIERDENNYIDVLKEEIEVGLSDLTKKEQEKVIIAYEPIWSIGTGIIPTNKQIEEVFNIIKKELPNNKILYGGSANDENISTIKKCKLIDGYLLGGISLKPDNLQKFINILEK